jgi:hypothetical protein
VLVVVLVECVMMEEASHKSRSVSRANNRRVALASRDSTTDEIIRYR